jgi:hypothetical protein
LRKLKLFNIIDTINEIIPAGKEKNIDGCKGLDVINLETPAFAGLQCVPGEGCYKKCDVIARTRHGASPRAHM